ncbi:MAG: hypothetical protein K0R99_3786 [Microbacterium sp.]|jgi:hypothetical protein|uniref:hypothetical protein n=1 Tax=Microbacterium sp. TaxID=51671 RepID=UPI0026298D45|nr:hypothetical protein [Microbacterium sp.]MDF2562340.1 hypothetical protein [Microbacterium sp.]
MTNKLKPGDRIHFLGTLTVSTAPGQGRPVQRGVELEVTQAILDANTDRTGSSWLSLVDDEAGQIARWGAVKFGRGPVPESVEWWNAPGDDASRSLARTLDRERLVHFTDPGERAAEAARIDAKYGRPVTSWTTGSTVTGWTGDAQ